TMTAKDGSYWPKGQRLAAYGEDRLEESVRAGYQIIVEGESDCWALWHHGFPALGLPGSDTVKKTLCSGHVGGMPTVYVWQEPDQSGQDFVAGVRARLRDIGWNGQLLVARLDGVKDPSELHCQDPERFKGRFQNALNSASPPGDSPLPGGQSWEE